MFSINIGDYVISKDRQIYRVVNIVNDITGTYYDIRSLNKFNTFHPYPVTQGLNHSQLRHFGEIVPVEKASSALKVLFSGS